MTTLLQIEGTKQKHFSLILQVSGAQEEDTLISSPPLKYIRTKTLPFQLDS